MWVTGETDLETARVADGRIVNCHYEVTSTAALSGVLDDLVSLLRTGAVPVNDFVSWHNPGNGEALR